MSCLRAIAAALVLISAGCASSPPSSGGASALNGSTPAGVPAKDRVLWEYRSALTAFRQGNYAEAQRQLDDALLTLGGISGGDKSARQSRRLFNEESKKTFIGEPYERVMAYFYRGILYWMNGEPDNARACFRSAQIQDSDTEGKEYRNDYVLLDYLEGLVNVKLASDGSDSLKRAQASFKQGKLPEYNPKANALIFMEFGNGPVKYSSGEYGEQLRFRDGRSQVKGAWLKLPNKHVRIGPIDDLLYQATTRGGRVMDHVLANKAVFKSSTDTFGDAAIISGAVLGAAGGRRGESISDTQIAGLGLVAAGIISKIFSAATSPAADTRAWDNLPQYISFVALELPPGPYTANVEFTDSAGTVLPALTKTVNFTVPAASDAVVFVSDRNS